MFQVNLLFAVFALTYGNRLNVTENHVYWDGKIVGGKNAAIEDYPYQLSFEYGGNHWCGAALIKPNVGITAAHCTEPIGTYLNFLSVRAGTAIKQQGGQVAKVAKICEHPKYDSDKSYDYDIAVMLLDKSLILNNAVQPVLLQPVGAEVKVGTLGSISGWGLLSEDGESPTNLQAVDVPKVDDEVCKTEYPTDVVTSRMCCYGYKDGGKDACKGDSGGPLVVNGKLEGIVSWGHGCATAKNPGVYCKISHPEIRSFIEECIKTF